MTLLEDSIIENHQCSRTPDGSSTREDAFHSVLQVVLTELHVMAHSIAEHGQEVRMGDIRTLRELVQELPRMEPLLRESSARRVVSPQLACGGPSDIDMFSYDPPVYRPTASFSLLAPEKAHKVHGRLSQGDDPDTQFMKGSTKEMDVYAFGSILYTVGLTVTIVKYSLI